MIVLGLTCHFTELLHAYLSGMPSKSPIHILSIAKYFTKLWSSGLDVFERQQTDIGEWMEELFSRDRINIKQNGVTRFICRFPCCGGNTVNFWPGMFINALCPRLGIIQGCQSVKTSQLLSTVLDSLSM